MSSTSAAAASFPRFTDSHVHFPTWSLAQRQVKLDGCASLDEALARVREADVPPGPLAARLRLAGRRLEPAPPADEGGARRGHGRDAGDHDLEGLPLGLAQLGRARGGGRRPRGRGRRRRAGRGWRADRHPARGVRLALPRPLRAHDRGRVGRGDARWDQACRTRAASVAIHDKDGWLGAPGIFQRLRDEGNLSLRVWGSIPHERLDERGRARAPLGLRRRVPPDRLPEVLHGRHARLPDRAHDRRHRRRDHEPRGVGGDHPSRRRARLAGRRARDRRPGQPERARRVRGDPRRLGAARACASGSSTRSA